MKGTRRVVITAVVAAAVAFGSLTSTTAGSAAERVRGVTDSEIKVGGLGYAAFYGAAGQAAKARFDEANENGEIPGGRTITFVGFADDKATADTNLTEGRRLVDREGVFAVVPVITAVLQAGQYFNQQKVPTVGWGISATFCDPTNRYAFAFTGCLVPNPPEYPGNTWGELVNEQLRQQGKGGAQGKTAAVIAENNDAGKQGAEVVAATARAVGMKVVYDEASVPPAPATVGDYTPYVQALMTSNGGHAPDVIFLTLSVTNVLGMGAALSQAGYKGIQTNATSYAPQLTGLAAGWSAFTGFATPEAANAGMQKILATLDNGGIATADINQATLGGYYSADMFVQILKKVGKNLTPERFQKVASRFTYEITDVVGPTVYPAGFQAATPCGQLATSDGTTWTITAPYGCYDVLVKKGNTWVPAPYPKAVR